MGRYRCLARCWATTPTRPSGRPGWRTCTCRRTCSSGPYVVVVRSGGRTILIDAGLGADPDLNLPRDRAVAPTTGGRRHRSRIRDRRGADPPAHGPHWRAARRRVRDRLRPDLRIHLAAAEAEFWESPDFRVSMPPGFPDGASAGSQAVLERLQQSDEAFRDGVRGYGIRPECRRSVWTTEPPPTRHLNSRAHSPSNWIPDPDPHRQR